MGILELRSFSEEEWLSLKLMLIRNTFADIQSHPSSFSALILLGVDLQHILENALEIFLFNATLRLAQISPAMVRRQMTIRLRKPFSAERICSTILMETVTEPPAGVNFSAIKFRITCKHP